MGMHEQGEGRKLEVRRCCLDFDRTLWAFLAKQSQNIYKLQYFQKSIKSIIYTLYNTHIQSIYANHFFKLFLYSLLTFSHIQCQTSNNNSKNCLIYLKPNPSILYLTQYHMKSNKAKTQSINLNKTFSGQITRKTSKFNPSKVKRSGYNQEEKSKSFFYRTNSACSNKSSTHKNLDEKKGLYELKLYELEIEAEKMITEMRGMCDMLKKEMVKMMKQFEHMKQKVVSAIGQEITKMSNFMKEGKPKDIQENQLKAEINSVKFQKMQSEVVTPKKLIELDQLSIKMAKLNTKSSQHEQNPEQTPKPQLSSPLSLKHRTLRSHLKQKNSPNLKNKKINESFHEISTCLIDIKKLLEHTDNSQ